ncbi:MAG TPA: hypothetical protein VHO46_04215, partial [Bacteroidales bacterium]|nr:hypothetical protein [Bacteroidales bacterium]
MELPLRSNVILNETFRSMPLRNGEMKDPMEHPGYFSDNIRPSERSVSIDLADDVRDPSLRFALFRMTI